MQAAGSMRWKLPDFNVVVSASKGGPSIQQAKSQGKANVKRGASDARSNGFQNPSNGPTLPPPLTEAQKKEEAAWLARLKLYNRCEISAEELGPRPVFHHATPKTMPPTPPKPERSMAASQLERANRRSPKHARPSLAAAKQNENMNSAVFTSKAAMERSTFYCFPVGDMPMQRAQAKKGANATGATQSGPNGKRSRKDGMDFPQPVGPVSKSRAVSRTIEQPKPNARASFPQPPPPSSVPPSYQPRLPAPPVNRHPEANAQRDRGRLGMQQYNRLATEQNVSMDRAYHPRAMKVANDYDDNSRLPVGSAPTSSAQPKPVSQSEVTQGRTTARGQAKGKPKKLGMIPQPPPLMAAPPSQPSSDNSGAHQGFGGREKKSEHPGNRAYDPAARRRYEPVRRDPHYVDDGYDDLDEDDDDFIDDSYDHETDWRGQLRQITQYDPSRYRERDKEEIVESNASRILAEDRLSSKIGAREDAIELARIEAEEKRSKAARR